MLTQEELIQLATDINEIQETLNRVKKGYPLDRKKAEDTIRKHNLTDPIVAVFNSPMRPDFVPFQQATDQMLINNLNTILRYLSAKLTGKSVDEILRNL